MGIKNRFYSIRVKKQNYMGASAITLYTIDETPKIRRKLNRMKYLEKKQTASQAEMFSSTVSHEMRTPLQTMIFFITQVLILISQIPSDPSKIDLSKHYCTIVKQQAEFLSSYVEDLLDLRQLRDGVFSLSLAPFHVKKVIEDVCNIFSLQSQAKNITVAVSDIRTLPKQLIGDERRFK